MVPVLGYADVRLFLAGLVPSPTYDAYLTLWAASAAPATRSSVTTSMSSDEAGPRS